MSKRSGRTVRVDAVDCRPPRPVVSVETGDVEVEFIFDASLKRGVNFAFGLFFDEVATRTKTCFRYPRAHRVCVLKESPIMSFYQDVEERERRYERILTFDSGLLRRGPQYERLDYGTSWLGWDMPESPATPVAKTRGVSFIGNIEHDPLPGYEFRREVVDWLLSTDGVDCFGRGIRWIESKREGLDAYRFSVAMENTRADYYYTEKLIDCFLTYTVPVYWGCQRVSELFDERGIVRFGSLEELQALLPTLTPERYERMRPFVEENRERAIRGRVHSAGGFFERVAEALVTQSRGVTDVPMFLTAKPLAGVRWCVESLFGGRWRDRGTRARFPE